MGKIKIAFLGLGGVGGFYGGKLAKRYSGSGNIGIYFIARGEHLKAIQESGLHIITGEEDFIAKPDLATDEPEKIGVVDYVIITTKSYDLKSSVSQIRYCIDNHTVILPLLNGGDITERIREILPDNTIWSGCSYIVSRKTQPGLIRVSGTLSKLLFGYDKGENEQLKSFERLLQEANIDAHLSSNIRETIWRKFFFISVSASLTSYYDISFNELVDTEEYLNMTVGMAEEFLKVAKAECIDLGENAVEQVVNRSEILPKGTTTSMHSDFKTDHQTEVETLTGVIVRLAQKHGIYVPLYDTVYNNLKNR
ncbi:MAG: ketopantoate reductase family protein [Paludibacteraceae bacterium]